MKKVLFLITKGNFGGAQRYVFDLATSLSHEEFEPVVAVGEGAVLEEKLKSAGVRVECLKTLGRNIKIWNDFLSFREIVRLINKEKPDVLHVNSAKAGGLGALAGRLCGVKKIVFTAHGWAFNEKRSVISKVIIYLLSFITIVLSHKMIAVSRAILEDTPFVSLVRRKISIIHNGISEIPFVERDMARDTLAPNTDGKFWVGSVAELHKNKGLDFLIPAFAEMKKTVPDAELVIVGEGEERMHLEKLANDLGISENVHLVGFKKDAASYLSAFDIFALPSRTDAFPYVISEAGLAKLPVVASRVGGIPEIIEDGISGVLTPVGDIGAVAEHLKLYATDENRRKNHGEALFEKVRSSLSLERMLLETSALYLGK